MKDGREHARTSNNIQEAQEAPNPGSYLKH